MQMKWRKEIDSSRDLHLIRNALRKSEQFFLGSHNWGGEISTPYQTGGSSIVPQQGTVK